MIYQIVDLFVGLASATVAGACLMLCYFDFFRINLGRVHGLLGNQIASFLLLVTNWLTLPIRKVIQNTGKVNLVYLISGYLIIVAKIIILSLFSHTLFSELSRLLLPILLSALIQYLDLFLSIISGITFVYVILSWISQGSPSYFLAANILEPLLVQLRKRLPNTGTFDFSALALLLIIKVLQIVVSNFR
ncbi:YggT family protein [Polynucleobacter kasalickyi]|uniref:YGGT family protein n=1 Tax=Polynucleobacter kasalickyi TaxID=1938817 RepID=A0A1W2AML1_9BURK|nr:YggT family protein [Polynucleobacter kasalickyi]SMC61844.1 YGGT family protein [Polynucleobacter kasalickyi]